MADDMALVASKIMGLLLYAHQKRGNNIRLPLVQLTAALIHAILDCTAWRSCIGIQDQTLSLFAGDDVEGWEIQDGCTGSHSPCLHQDTDFGPPQAASDFLLISCPQIINIHDQNHSFPSQEMESSKKIY